MARGKHGKKTRLNTAKFLRFLGVIALAAVLIAALIIGLKSCGKAKDTAPAGGTESLQPSGGQAEEASASGPAVAAPGNDQPEPPHEPTLQEIAASMQDYSHEPGKQAAPVTVQDENYLILINRTHPLGPDYWPDDLVTVSKTVAGVGNNDTKKMRRVAAEAIEKMIAGAAEQGIDIAVRTGFRSYQYQKDLYSGYVQRNGEAKANTFSAKAGESEHQTGLACDLGGKSQSYALKYDFGKTKEGQWVYDHCAEYGFILRFIDGTEDKAGDITGYVYEPWHIRYVGEEAAREIMEKGITLEEYLGVID